MARQKVQIWDSHKPLELNKLSIGILPEKKTLPANVNAAVDIAWKEFQAKNPKAKDAQVAYLVSYKNINRNIVAEVFLEGFRFNQFLNRNPKAELFRYTANDNYFNPLASWILPEVGSYVLFGNKKDFGNRKVSGFGGFTSPDDIADTQINPYAHIQRKIVEEMGPQIVERILHQEVIGLDFLPLIGTKGFDLIYTVLLDGNPETIAKAFNENPQFSKNLIPVRADPKSLVEFLNSPEWEPTTSCVGGVLNYIGSRFGSQELIKAARSYTGPIEITSLLKSPKGDVRRYTLV